MKNKTLSILLSISLLLPAFSTSVLAEEVSDTTGTIQIEAAEETAETETSDLTVESEIDAEPVISEEAVSEVLNTDEETDTELTDEAGIPADGIYTAEADTGAAMFKVVGVKLTVKNGKMTAIYTLSGQGYDYLFAGTNEEAFAADESSWAPAVIDEEGMYTYELPAAALDKPLTVASRSKKYASQGKGAAAWLNRTITVKSSSLVKIGDVSSDPGEDVSVSRTHAITATTTNAEGGVSGMYTMDTVIVTEQEDGSYLVRMHQASANRNLMALTESVEDATAHSVDWNVGGGADGYWFVIPVADLNQPIKASFSSTDRVASGKKWGNIMTITFDPASMTETSEAEVTAAEIKIDPAVKPEPEPVEFTDVKKDDFYYDAVQWAVNNKITTGITPEKFAPNDRCTRAQVVTFLWRAAGQPEPKSLNNPFKDVSDDADYLKAVLWAAEKGITTGITPTTFQPNATTNRGQVMTFLWRAAGKPEPASAVNRFKDVSENSVWYKAVLWAAEKGITTGTTPTTFQPNRTANRSQVVTFLYRAK